MAPFDNNCVVITRLMLVFIDGNYAVSVENVEKVIAKGGGQCVGK